MAKRMVQINERKYRKRRIMRRNKSSWKHWIAYEYYSAADAP